MTEQKTKRTYSREFKQEAVRLYETSGKTMSELERELGITPFLLAKWVQETKRKAGQAFPGRGKLREQDDELRRLRRENEILRQEREILKKAVNIFSQTKR